MGFLAKIFGIKQTDFRRLLIDGAIIIDVRTLMECKDGKIKNSKNIPLDSISSKIKKLKKQNQVIIFCCASGVRSAKACRIAKANGIQAYNGGGWRGLNRKIN
ncbi:MAG: rhodanese-like domain-containing protein [Flavobacteriales bacterium]|nr:rhodanese-like domain-containing protein [Flavobacteriales bacterium]